MEHPDYTNLCQSRSGLSGIILSIVHLCLSIEISCKNEILLLAFFLATDLDWNGLIMYAV